MRKFTGVIPEREDPSVESVESGVDETTVYVILEFSSWQQVIFTTRQYNPLSWRNNVTVSNTWATSLSNPLTHSRCLAHHTPFNYTARGSAANSTKTPSRAELSKRSIIMGVTSFITGYVAPVFIIISPITSYADQTLSIHKNKSSAGFSLDIPLIMLVASILR